MESTRITHTRIGNLDVKITSELVDNKPLDTKVEITGGTLCYISGETIDSFFYELNAIVNKYRI